MYFVASIPKFFVKYLASNNDFLNQSIDLIPILKCLSNAEARFINRLPKQITSRYSSCGCV